MHYRELKKSIKKHDFYENYSCKLSASKEKCPPATWTNMSSVLDYVKTHPRLVNFFVKEHALNIIKKQTSICLAQSCLRRASRKAHGDFLKQAIEKVLLMECVEF